MKKTALLLTLFTALIFNACSGKENKKESADASESETMALQPLESGTYVASYYDIEGKNARKGHFDGRMLVALSEEASVIYVYENGNHAKIDYLISLQKPFEKGDSGIYRTVDKEGLPVIIRSDSLNTLNFEKKDQKVSIEFDKTPKSTQPAFDVLSKIQELVSK